MRWVLVHLAFAAIVVLPSPVHAAGGHADELAERPTNGDALAKNDERSVDLALELTPFGELAAMLRRFDRRRTFWSEGCTF